ncbi:MAG: hypothetical protein ABI658_08485 [Acidimicrobiales bacterium]
MLVVVGLLGTLCVSVVVIAVAQRSVLGHAEVLRVRAAKLVRLSVAVDDLHHETTHVVPAYRGAATRARTLRRPEDPESGR